MARIGPELAQIDESIAAVKERGRAAQSKRAQLAKSHNDLISRAKRTYDRTVSQLNRSGAQKSAQYHTYIRRAKQNRDTAISNAEKKNRPRARKIQANINAAVKELRALQARRAKLLKDAKK